jgi:chromatin assembly factor 1 subunit B
VILWVPSDKPQTGFGETSNEELVDKEHWRAQRILQCVHLRSTISVVVELTRLRVTTKHVYDLAWSPDSEFLIAGSTDNTASIWKAGTGEFELLTWTWRTQLTCR